uniref:Uncharacterized protein n=1 Tax=viral metagenome TaxID=1070528 RepID=A0A6C0JGF1_9ZZZZ
MYIKYPFVKIVVVKRKNAISNIRVLSKSVIVWFCSGLNLHNSTPDANICIIGVMLEV